MMVFVEQLLAKSVDHSIWCLVSGIWRLVSVFCFLVFFVWSLASGVWCLVSHCINTFPEELQSFLMPQVCLLSGFIL